jgi:hypothetical protein
MPSSPKTSSNFGVTVRHLAESPTFVIAAAIIGIVGTVLAAITFADQYYSPFLYLARDHMTTNDVDSINIKQIPRATERYSTEYPEKKLTNMTLTVVIDEKTASHPTQYIMDRINKVVYNFNQTWLRDASTEDKSAHFPYSVDVWGSIPWTAEIHLRESPGIPETIYRSGRFEFNNERIFGKAPPPSSPTPN